jgi:RecJ-like exonuclease
MNFVPDPNPESLAPSGLPSNVLTLEAFTANSVLSPVTDQMPCPICKGQGVVATTYEYETGHWNSTDCQSCGGSGEVPIALHDAIIEDMAEQAWDAGVH